MKPKVAAAVALFALLIGSNGYWIYRLIDLGHWFEDQNSSLEMNHKALAQALAILPIVASPNAGREEVIAAALHAADGGKSFEKDGYLWTGYIGLRFDPNGRLIEAVPAWSPF